MWIDLKFLPSDNYNNYNKNCNIHNRKKRHKCASKSRGDKAYSVHPVPKSRGDLSLCPPYDQRPWKFYILVPWTEILNYKRRSVYVVASEVFMGSSGSRKVHEPLKLSTSNLLIGCSVNISYKSKPRFTFLRSVLPEL